MHKTRLAALGFAAATALVATSAGVASADPVNAKNSFQVQVVCNNGHTYTVVTNGDGNFTPAHDLGGNAVLIPVSFGPITFTVKDAKGNILDQETDPATSKGSSAKNPGATTSCSFSGGATAPDGTSFSIVGTVVGFVTPG